MSTDLEFGQKIWDFARSDMGTWQGVAVALEGFFTGQWSLDEFNARMIRLRGEVAGGIIDAELDNLKKECVRGAYGE